MKGLSSTLLLTLIGIIAFVLFTTYQPIHYIKKIVYRYNLTESHGIYNYSLIPKETNTYDVGNYTNRWRWGFFSQKIYVPWIIGENVSYVLIEPAINTSKIVDRDNAFYYVDPSGTTKLNWLYANFLGQNLNAYSNLIFGLKAIQFNSYSTRPSGIGWGALWRRSDGRLVWVDGSSGSDEVLAYYSDLSNLNDTIKENYYNKTEIDSWNLIKNYVLAQDLNANGYSIFNASEINSSGYVWAKTAYGDWIGLGGDAGGNDLEIRILAPSDRNYVVVWNPLLGQRANFKVNSIYAGGNLYITGAIYDYDDSDVNIGESMYVTGTIKHDDYGIIFQTTNGHIREEAHVGCGNYEIMANAYCSGGTEYYAANYSGTQPTGAAEIDITYDFGQAGRIDLMVAPVGYAGDVIPWIKYSFQTTKADFQKPVYAPAFYDKDNTAYYVNPAGTSVFNTIDIGYQIITASTTTSAQIIAYCPTGKKVIGGGCNCGGYLIKVSAPLTDGSGWQCQCSGYSSTIGIGAYAICVRVT